MQKIFFVIRKIFKSPHWQFSWQFSFAIKSVALRGLCALALIAVVNLDNKNGKTLHVFSGSFAATLGKESSRGKLKPEGIKASAGKKSKAPVAKKSQNLTPSGASSSKDLSKNKPKLPKPNGKKKSDKKIIGAEQAAKSEVKAKENEEETPEEKYEKVTAKNEDTTAGNQPANALPLPRYVSLRANAVNLHVGPGNNYPTSWRYVRRSLPVEIIAEFDTWRQVRDCHGAEGWLHKSMLSGTRTVYVLNKTRKMRKNPEENARVIANLEPGVIAKAIECQGNWCKIEAKSPQGKLKGWVKRHFLWGIYPNETKFN